MAVPWEWRLLGSVPGTNLRPRPSCWRHEMAGAGPTAGAASPTTGQHPPSAAMSAATESTAASSATMEYEVTTCVAAFSQDVRKLLAEEAKPRRNAMPCSKRQAVISY